MKNLLIVALFLNVALLAGRFWQEMPVSAQGGGAGENPCEADPTLYSLDVNADGEVVGTVTDAVYMLTWLFSGGNPPRVCLAENGPPRGALKEVFDITVESGEYQTVVACDSDCSWAGPLGETDCDAPPPEPPTLDLHATCVKFRRTFKVIPIPDFDPANPPVVNLYTNSGSAYPFFSSSGGGRPSGPRVELVDGALFVQVEQEVREYAWDCQVLSITGECEVGEWLAGGWSRPIGFGIPPLKLVLVR